MRLLLALGLLVLGAGAARAQDLEAFRTPSDNIHCLVISDGGATAIECELRERGNGDPIRPKPADCELDWGSRFAIADEGEAILLCHGDTLVAPDSAVLAYGEALARGGLSCLSEKQGLTCRNGKGRGFRLSRAEQELF